MTDTVEPWTCEKAYNMELEGRRRVQSIPKSFRRIRQEVERVLERLEVMAVRQDPHPGTPRTLSIEHSQWRRTARVDHANPELDSDRNFTPSLVLHPIREGKFHADISLDTFPSNRNLLLLIRNQHLDVNVLRECKEKKWKSTTVLLKPCGKIDLPIYLDSDTLRFALVDENKLRMVGCTKFTFKTNRPSELWTDSVLKEPPLVYHLPDNMLMTKNFRLRAHTH